MQIPIWELFLRIAVLYILVAIALRIMGKREIGQLAVFDFVVSVMIAELSALPMEDPDQPMMQAILSIGTLVVLQVLVALVQMKSHRFRHFVDGEPTVLIEHGQIQDKKMRKIRYNISDLMMQLREKGYANVADVEFAILETTGTLSVFPRGEKRPLTAADLGQPVAPESIHMPLVADGTIVQKSLKSIGRDEQWLLDELKRRGHPSLEDVFYASIDERGTLFIDAVDGTGQQNHHKTGPEA